MSDEKKPSGRGPPPERAPSTPGRRTPGSPGTPVGQAVTRPDTQVPRGTGSGPHSAAGVRRALTPADGTGQAPSRPATQVPLGASSVAPTESGFRQALTPAHGSAQARTKPQVPLGAGDVAPTSSTSMRAISAARTRPLPSSPRFSRGDIRKGAESTALNVAAILRELLADFRSSDRFFKYKAGIIVAWVCLSATGFVVACPPAEETNEIGAHLVVAGVTGSPTYMVKNTSPEPWRDVVLVVNGRYRAAFAQVAPNEGVSLTVRQLADANGKPAPADLKVSGLEVLTSEGGTTLISGGQPR